MPVVSDVPDDKPKRRPSPPFLVAAVALVLLGMTVIPLLGGVQGQLGSYAITARLEERWDSWTVHGQGFGRESRQPGEATYWLRVGKSEASLNVLDVPAFNRFQAALKAAQATPKAAVRVPPAP